MSDIHVHAEWRASLRPNGYGAPNKHFYGSTSASVKERALRKMTEPVYGSTSAYWHSIKLAVRFSGWSGSSEYTEVAVYTKGVGWISKGLETTLHTQAETLLARMRLVEEAVGLPPEALL